jgi:hypothetical protein
MSEDEKIIIHCAVLTAMEFGTGLISAARRELEDYQYTWTESHEKYVFENYIEGEAHG